MAVKILTGDVAHMLKTLPDRSVHCVVTSPPYWRLRDYGVVGQIGLEPTPEEYVAKLVAVFREVRRVLRDDGTLWLNLGDSYAGSWGNSGHWAELDGGESVQRQKNTDYMPRGGYENHRSTPPTANIPGLKTKNLVGVPWRVAFALQADGWWLRSDIIWHKPNPMPESVTDRPTKSHEYLFLLTKSARYFYDAEAVKELALYANDSRAGKGRIAYGGKRNGLSGTGQESFVSVDQRRNLRTVWTIPTSPYPDAHFAVFPARLVEPCIKAGTSEYGCCPTCGAPWVRVMERTAEIAATAKGSRFDQGKTGINGNGRTQPGERFVKVATGWRATCDHDAESVPCTVLDPFLGSGTTAAVAAAYGRDAIGIELNPVYVELARKRIAAVGPLLLEIN